MTRRDVDRLLGVVVLTSTVAFTLPVIASWDIREAAFAQAVTILGCLGLAVALALDVFGSDDGRPRE